MHNIDTKGGLNFVVGRWDWPGQCLEDNFCGNMSSLGSQKDLILG